MTIPINPVQIRDQGTLQTPLIGQLIGPGIADLIRNLQVNRQMNASDTAAQQQQENWQKSFGLQSSAESRAGKSADAMDKYYGALSDKAQNDIDVQKKSLASKTKALQVIQKLGPNIADDKAYAQAVSGLGEDGEALDYLQNYRTGTIAQAGQVGQNEATARKNRIERANEPNQVQAAGDEAEFQKQFKVAMAKDPHLRYLFNVGRTGASNVESALVAERGQNNVLEKQARGQEYDTYSRPLLEAPKIWDNELKAWDTKRAAYYNEGKRLEGLGLSGGGTEKFGEKDMTEWEKNNPKPDFQNIMDRISSVQANAANMTPEEYTAKRMRVFGQEDQDQRVESQVRGRVPDAAQGQLQQDIVNLKASRDAYIARGGRPEIARKTYYTELQKLPGIYNKPKPRLLSIPGVDDRLQPTNP